MLSGIALYHVSFEKHFHWCVMHRNEATLALALLIYGWRNRYLLSNNSPLYPTLAVLT